MPRPPNSSSLIVFVYLVHRVLLGAMASPTLLMVIRMCLSLTQSNNEKEGSYTLNQDIGLNVEQSSQSQSRGLTRCSQVVLPHMLHIGLTYLMRVHGGPLRYNSRSPITLHPYRASKLAKIRKHQRWAYGEISQTGSVNTST